jgi:hypothetical protein
MSGKICRAVIRARVLFAFLTFALIASAHLDSTSVVPNDGDAVSWRPAPVGIPAGLTNAIDDLEGGLVAAITADIDADGDLDLVATDRALNLLVWVNDGTGHFTRERPRQAAGVRTSAPAPTLERRSRASLLSTVDDPPAAGLPQCPALDDGLPCAARPATADPFSLRSTASDRPSRAPPATAPLT